jgi:hypothetical protein
MLFPCLPKKEFDAQLYDFPGTNCHFNKEFDTSISVVSLSTALLRNKLTMAIKGILY